MSNEAIGVLIITTASLIFIFFMIWSFWPSSHDDHNEISEGTQSEAVDTQSDTLTIDNTQNTQAEKIVSNDLNDDNNELTSFNNIGFSHRLSYDQSTTDLVTGQNNENDRNALFTTNPEA